MSITKRRLVSLLPQTNQTDDLKTFFGATVDAVFQPGRADEISGYIGHTLSGQTDFYVGEPDATRAFYQLEPGMVSFDSTDTKTLNYALTYPHLVDYLTVRGANTTDQQRLFETDYYSWSPPINIDMLANYRRYYWFGDVALSAADSYSFNQLDANDDVILSNGNLTVSSPGTTNGIVASVRSVPVDDGSWYIELRIEKGVDHVVGLANTTDPINNQIPGGSPGFQTGNDAVVYTVEGQVFNDTGSLAVASTLLTYGEGNVIGIAWSTLNRKLWFRVDNGKWNNASDDPSINSGGFDLTGLLANGPACVYWGGSDGGSTSAQATINFGATAFAFSPPVGFLGPATILASADQPTLVLSVPHAVYHGDGSTVSFPLPASCLCVPSQLENPTAYVNNIPVAAQVSGDNIVLNTPPHANDVVMVCRTPDLVSVINGETVVDVSDLNTQDVTFLSSSMRVNVVDTSHIVNAWDSLGWDDGLWDASGDANYMVDGIGTGLRLTPLAQMIRGRRPQYVTIDRSSHDANLWSVQNFWVHEDAFAWSGQQFPARQATRPIIEFVRDIVLFPGQVWQDGADPLFMLYDLDNRALNDYGYYPNSTFTGNRIFGFARGSEPLDSVLARSLKHDNNGYIVFENDATTVSYQFLLGNTNPVVTSIVGLNAYAVSDGMTTTYHAFWQPTAEPTTQSKTNGFYNIPTNLKSNPLYEEVMQISKAEWQDHFTSIIANQAGFSGLSSGSNNYRDTLRDPSLGTQIVQHVAPLPKVMLLAASADFDLARAIRYADQEYNRFRNKFARKLVDLRNRGQLSDDDAPTVWVSTALNALKIGHTTSFPFALSPMAGAQYFIPSTPTALGMQPSAVPALVNDIAASGQSVVLLRGHDGSHSPTFGDWRDAIMLALETQIYQNLPGQFKTEARPVFDINRWIGGFFYTPSNGYTFAEFTAVMGPLFELWAQVNRLNFRTNTSYDRNNPFTWNYRNVADRSGNPLPGNWRAIYRFYFGTDAPHTRPWEMLGFASQPSWWATHYGAAPYGRSNAMWTDLENGTILSGPRQGTDPIYARPGLSRYIPVNAAGTLLDPVAAGIVAQVVPDGYGSRPWQAGDHSPIENLWYNSPAYRFALALASFYLKPARFVAQCWDALNIGMVNGQWVELNTLLRPLDAALYVHGETNPTLTPPSVVSVTGLSQWISDYLISVGQTPDIFGHAVRGLNVALIHQMAGFVSKDDVQLVADSFGLLPAEDVQVILYPSPSISTEVYSGVIIEWTGSSWRVFGYDGRSPFFTIIPPNTTGQKGLISLATAAEPTIVEWHSGTYYPVSILASYQNSVYQCLRSHSSGSHFETSFWKARPDLATAMIRAPRVVTYLNGLNTTVSVPYGTEYFNYQDIANFLLGYERYLVSRGWTFEYVDPSTGRILNWSLSVEEFLTWAQVQWAPGNFIALSPGQAFLQFTAETGTIQNVEDNVTGFYGLVNRSGQPIDQRSVTISRLDGTISIQANKTDMFLARLEINNIEHALVMSNVTIFNDNIYLPLYGMRQERLRLSCYRAQGWVGRLDAPGFIINDDTLASSFEKAANDIRYMFDIEKSQVRTLRDYARHVVGMTERSYLNNLLLSHDDQFELYQGMIQEKGAPGVFHKLGRSSLASNNSVLQFLDEWAFRVGRFGAPIDPFATFQLSQSDVRNDPQYVRFNPLSNGPLDWITLQPNDTRWLDKPADNSKFFDQATDYNAPILPTAGPVRLTEVDLTAFHVADLPALYSDTSNLPTNTTIWVYEADPIFQGTNYYVDAVFGNDSNDGLSSATAYSSLQRAHDGANPGDVINIAGGIYLAAGTGTNVLEITRSGLASAPITYKAVTGFTPVVLGAQSYAAIHVNAASYIIIEGLEVAGWNSQFVLSDVQSAVAQGGTLPIRYNGMGIAIDRGISSVQSHHVTIKDCIVHDFPNSGIFASFSDYLTIDNCMVYSNALYSPLGGSGIEVLNSHSFDQITTYKTFVRQNICYDNINLIPNTDTGTLSNGCGISIDGNLNDKSDGLSYNGRTLVENNLCYNNGGNGILINDCALVDAIFNTAYQNQTNTTRQLGEIAAFYSHDSNIVNNIMVALETVPIATDLANENVLYRNNLVYGGNNTIVPGVAGHSDPLFVAPNKPIAPDFRPGRGSFAINAASPLFTTTVDQAGSLRSASSGFDIGCYQTASVIPPVVGRHPYDVLMAFDVGVNGYQNQVLTVTSNTENSAVKTTRMSFQYLMTIGADDIGNYLIIDGLSQSNPELQGLQIITAVHPELNSVDLQTVSTAGFSFLSNLVDAPSVRILRSVRFDTVGAINPNYLFAVGSLVYIDHYLNDQWAVLQWSGTHWLLYRQQPHRMNQQTIGETVIYSAGAQINGSRMVLNRPVVADLAIVDPPSGFICNISDREISYRTAYDPARYNAGSSAIDANIWGPNEVGKVWWNLATCRFLDVFTDLLDLTDDRTLTELNYRIYYWGQVAPGCSVDVYEWIESTIDPITYSQNTTLPGTVFNGTAASYVQRQVYDPATQTDTTLYYFWVSGLTTVPSNLADRHSSVTTIAAGIANPLALGVAWMGAISPDSLLVSGVHAELDETTTVMKIRLIESAASVGHHDQWMLMRRGDETSLPTDAYWTRARDGLAAFAIEATAIAVPDPRLPPTRNTGIEPGQNIFQVGELTIPNWVAGQAYYFGDQVSNNGFAYLCLFDGISGTAGGPTGYSTAIVDGTTQWSYRGTDGSRTGLLDARRAFVGSVNRVLAATPAYVTRTSLLTTIRRQTPIDVTNNILTWAQFDSSYPFEPPPSNEWDAPWEVHSLAERNDLLARSEFIDAVLNNQSISVLLNGIANILPQWSIWSLDPVAANRVLESNLGIRPGVALISNADLCFTLKKAFEYAVGTETERNNLIPSLKDGDRVYVANETQGFWAIWQWQRTGTTSGEFSLWRVQTYDTTGFLQDIDWYADGYSAANPPIISYPTIAQRNATEGSTAPTNRLVKILNDGTGKFNWTAFVDGQWEVVAIEDGTVQLSDAFYDPLRTVYAVVTPTSPNLLPSNTTLATAITNRDGSWEMRILAHALRYSGLLTESEINQIWFDIVNFCHVQQNEVEWAFKTSFMTLNGIAVPLQETPVLMADQTQNVVDFVNEVKPYHVKVRQSAIQYNPTLDTANGAPTDFDDPVYTDPLTGLQRALDPTDPTDQAILQLAPYADWYQNFATNGALIRHFTVTLLFDRIAAVSGNWDMSNWDTVLWDSGEGDGGAAYRLLTYYAPTAGMPPVDLEILLGLDAKTDAISSVLAGSFDSIDDGGTFVPETYDVDINPPLTSQPGGFDLRDPYVAAGQPEERVSFGADDGLQVIVTAKPLPGAPPQIIKVFEVGTTPGQTTTLFYDFMACSASAIMVFCDGVRAVLDTDYTVDLFARSITLNLTVNGSPVQRCAIHAFGCGSSSLITEQHYLSYTAPPFFPQEVVLGSYYDWMFIGDLVMASGGTGYSVDDVLTVTGGVAPSGAAQFNVYEVDENGAITVIGISSFKWMQISAMTFPNALSGGTGTGATAAYYQGPPAAPFVRNLSGAGMTNLSQIMLSAWVCVGSESESFVNNDFGINAQNDNGPVFTAVFNVSAQHSTTMDVSVAVQIGNINIPPSYYNGTWTGTVPIYNVNSIKNYVANLMISWDSLAETMQVYVNDTALTEAGAWSGPVSLTNVHYWTIAETTSFLMPIGVADIWINDAKVDLSVSSNRRQWINADLTAIALPSDGEITSTVVPKVFLHVASGGTASDFYSNGGTGGSWIFSVGGGFTPPIEFPSETTYMQFVPPGDIPDILHCQIGDTAAAGLTLDSPSIAENVEVIVDGVQLTNSQYTVNGTQVTLTSPPSDGTDVALVVYDGGFDSASMMQIETLSYDIGQTWTLSLRDQQTMPEHAGTIIEVNGLRLTPPTTIYGSMTVAAPYVYIPQAPDVTTIVTVYYNGQQYTHSIPVCTTTSPTSNYPFQVVLPGAAPPTTIAGQFVLYENLLIALDPNFVSDNVVVVLTYTDSAPDYTVVNGVLTITKALSNSDVITSTTFTNAATMGIQTVAFNLGAPILETVVPQPFAKNYVLVTMNGLALQPDDDFKIETQSFSLGEVYFSRPVLTLNNPEQSGSVVATVFTGAAAREAMQWQYVTKTPASIRMIPALVTVQNDTDNVDGYDVAPLDTQPFDETQAVGVPTNGPITDPRPQFRIDTTFEYARLSPYMAGTLVADIPVGAASFDVQLFLQPIATKLQDPFPLPVPDNAHNRPGVVYIEGERIEYFGYSRSGNVVTISQLRRATRGTSMGSKRLVLTGTGTGSQETYAFPATGVLDFTLDDVPVLAEQFTVVINGGNTQVTFTASAGSYIVMGLTLDVTHLKGATVYNGAMTFLKDVPIGPDVGNRELQPMHQIIAN